MSTAHNTQGAVKVMRAYTVNMGHNVIVTVQAVNVRDAAEKGYGARWDGPSAGEARYFGIDAADVTMVNGDVVRAVKL